MSKQRDRTAARHVLGGLGDQLLDVRGHRAEIAALRGCVDLHHRLNVILRHHCAGASTFDVGDAAENRRRLGLRGRDRQRLQLVQRVHFILRRLHHDGVRNAVLGTEEEGRRHLRATGEIDDHAVRHVARGHADILRARPVDIDIEAGTVGGLLNPRVGDTRDQTNAAQQLVGILEIGIRIGATDLQIDRRRRSEIQDLADDVGGQERKRHAGECARQPFPQFFHVIGGRTVSLFQLDLDVAVLRPDHAGVVVGHVDARDRHADIVSDGINLVRRNDPANLALHVGQPVGRLLHPCANLLTDMDQHLTRIDRRKEIPPQERHQQKRQRNAAEKPGHEHPAMVQREHQNAAVDPAESLEPRLERALEPDQRIARYRPVLVMDMRLQQILRHGRHQCARQDERPDHGEHHRQRHRHEQEPRDPGQEEHRHEHDADAQQRDERRRHDLVRAVEDRGFYVLALLEVPVDVLDGHGRIIDEDADREREAAERHDVEGLADQRQHDDGAEHGERNRNGDDQRRPPASEKQQDHHAGQKRRDHALECDAGNGVAHEDRLIADQPDLQGIGQRVADFGDLFLDAADDVQSGHRSGLQHHHQHRPAAIDVNDIGLRRIAVPDVCDVVNIDHGAIGGLDRQIAEAFDRQRRVVQVDGIFELADLLRAHRGNDVLRRQRIGDILRRQSARLQRGRIEIDLDLALLAAKGPWDRGPRHGHERRPQLVGRDVEQILFCQSLTHQRDLNDRHGRGVVVEDQRRRRTGRHLLDHGLRDRRDLRIRSADIHVRLKEDLDDADAVVGIGDDMFDVIDGRGQRTLERRGDAAGHLIRRQSGVGPDHADHGNPDVGKDIGRRTERLQRTDDQQQQRQNHKRVRAAQRNADERYHLLVFPTPLPLGRPKPAKSRQFLIRPARPAPPEVP